MGVSLDGSMAWYGLLLVVLLVLLRKLQVWLRLSRAKHSSLRGHSKMARRLVRLLPYYQYDEQAFFASDGAPAEVQQQRSAGLSSLERLFSRRSPETLQLS